jgi:hypothetical protein
MRFDPEMQRAFFNLQAAEVFAVTVVAWLILAAVVTLVPLMIGRSWSSKATSWSASLSEVTGGHDVSQQSEP